MLAQALYGGTANRSILVTKHCDKYIVWHSSFCLAQSFGGACTQIIMECGILPDLHQGYERSLLSQFTQQFRYSLAILQAPISICILQYCYHALYDYWSL